MRKTLKRVDLPLIVLTAALAVGCAFGIGHVACVIALHVPFDPNEGWNATFADLAMRTGSPYPAGGSFITNNYPPLSFYLVGALAQVFGDAIVAGRVIALLSLLAVAFAIETVLRRMGCSRVEALFGALFFVAAVMLTSDYAGMDDPQMLGHAISMVALVVLLPEPRGRVAIVVAAALCVIAVFVKHNLVVVPLALAVWLFFIDRSRAVLFAVAGIVFMAIGLVVFSLAFGVTLLSQLASPRLYSATNIESAIAAWLSWSAVPFVAAAFLAWFARRDRFALFAVLYAALAIAVGAALAGGDGVDANVFFDADIALALCAGLLFRHLRDRRPQAAVAAAAFAIPLLMGLGSLDEQWWRADYWLSPMAEETHAANQEIALIRQARGPVLCEMLSLCYWAGKLPEVDVFNTAEAFATGARSDRALAGLIAHRRYALIELEANEAFPLTPRIHAVLDKEYRILRNDEDRVFYAPR